MACVVRRVSGDIAVRSRAIARDRVSTLFGGTPVIRSSGIWTLVDRGLGNAFRFAARVEKAPVIDQPISIQVAPA